MNTSTETLNLRYWDTTDSSFSYPELSDEQLKYQPILDRPNTGICFSGGGTVSATLVPGYIKALENLGLMKHVRYISLEREIVPEFYYWNLTKKENLPESRLLNFGDGGILENSGVTALLARKVENIVIFLTEPFDINPVSSRDCEKAQRQFGHNQIAQLFGQKATFEEDEDTHKWKTDYHPDETVQVFEGSQFSTLKKALNDAKSHGGPVIVQGQYDVVPNKLLSVKGGWKCNVIWVCVDTCTEFNDQLPKDVREMIKNDNNDELHNFPAICTFKQNKKKEGKGYYMIQLNPMQANLLSNQAYWSVMKKQDMFSSFLKPQ